MATISPEERRGRTDIQPAPERFDVIAIGGGQAGLVAGYHLARRELDFAILHAHQRAGDAWRHRWDSPTYFTPGAAGGSSKPAIRPCWQTVW